MMPGNIVSPERSRTIRFSRSSSFTLRARSLCSEKVLFLSSPRVRGRFMKGLWAIIRRKSRHSMYVPVPGSLITHTQGLFHFGNTGAVVFDQRFNPLRLRFHLQKCLLEIQVYGKFMCQMERKVGNVWACLHGLAQDLK